MRRLLTVIFCAVALGAGCARSAPVDVAMVSAHDEPTRFAFAPQYVDVRHESKGWQRIPLATSATKMELLEYGHRVRLATSNLPKGTYTAIRLGYLVPMQEDGTTAAEDGASSPEVRRTSKTRTLGELQLQQQEVTILRTFCVDRSGNDNQLTLQIFRAHPEHVDEGPSVSIIQSPSC